VFRLHLAAPAASFDESRQAIEGKVCFGLGRIVGDGSRRELGEQAVDPAGELAGVSVIGIAIEDGLYFASRLLKLRPQFRQVRRWRALDFGEKLPSRREPLLRSRSSCLSLRRGWVRDHLFAGLHHLGTFKKSTIDGWILSREAGKPPRV